jgi:HPt (histidine-containing phosphotransfer) domain-containing protein
MPGRLDELRAGIAALGRGAPEASRSLRDLLHRLAGSGGSYGFTELSAIAREGERWLAGNPGSIETQKLTSLVQRLATAIQTAEAQLSSSAVGERSSLVPRALVIMRPTPQRDRIAQELRNAGYDVRFAARQDDPGMIPSEQLPHLVVIGGRQATAICPRSPRTGPVTLNAGPAPWFW